jgi:hypothetical protein
VLLKQAQANLPAGRIKTLADDKAADSEDVHELLSDNLITVTRTTQHAHWGSASGVLRRRSLAVRVALAAASEMR